MLINQFKLGAQVRILQDAIIYMDGVPQSTTCEYYGLSSAVGCVGVVEEVDLVENIIAVGGLPSKCVLKDPKLQHWWHSPKQLELVEAQA